MLHVQILQMVIPISRHNYCTTLCQEFQFLKRKR
nr:MAG TPA: hypothetical protein [Caudoviricetes sp.]